VGIWRRLFRLCRNFGGSKTVQCIITSALRLYIIAAVTISIIVETKEPRRISLSQSVGTTGVIFKIEQPERNTIAPRGNH
jgi:hypothetical protein